MEGKQGDVVVRLRASDRAKRVLIRVDALGSVELVLPRGVSRREGEAFLRSRWQWVEKQLGDLPPQVPFTHGHTIPVLGSARVIWNEPASRGRPRLDDGRLIVPGPASEVANRVRRCLVGTARDHVERECRRMAAAVGRPVTRISVRDTRSRWGSCSAKGALSFSWRLVLAPAAVMDYVIAHEVAHLVELNHSDRFWRVVADLSPDYRRHRLWLRRNGANLYRYG